MVSPIREVTEPIPLPTYLGKEVYKDSEFRGTLGASTSSGEPTRMDLAWSHGLGLEVSPIKTRSTRKKLGTNLSFLAHHLDSHLDQGALRGMKSLAWEK
jgi:hypothetical protein